MNYYLKQHLTCSKCYKTVAVIMICKRTFAQILCSDTSYWSIVHLQCCQFLVHSKVIQFCIFFILVSITGYYKAVNRVPCALQWVFVVSLLYISQCVSVNPKLLIYPSPPKLGFLMQHIYNCHNVEAPYTSTKGDIVSKLCNLSKLCYDYGTSGQESTIKSLKTIVLCEWT